MIISNSLDRAIHKNFGGPLTDRGRLTGIPAVKLWDLVLSQRAVAARTGVQNPIMDATLARLREGGFEDPFELTPEIITHAKKVLANSLPKTELAAAISLFRSVIPAQSHFEFEGAAYFGSKEIEGGLNIPYNDDSYLPLRLKYGNFLPKELLSLPARERFAICLEYSFLLTTLFRSAGINAQVMVSTCHASVIVSIDGKRYNADAVEPRFTLTNKSPSPDRISVSMHYCFKADIFALDKKYDKALLYYELALELAPDSSDLWECKSEILRKLRKFDEADKCMEISKDLLKRQRPV